MISYVPKFVRLDPPPGVGIQHFRRSPPIFENFQVIFWWSNLRLVKFEQWSNLTTGQITNWSNSRMVKFDHWSNSHVVKSAWFRDLAISTKWSNLRLVKLDHWSILTTGQIQKWSNSKVVKFDHWSNSQVVKSAEFQYLAISTKWSNSRLVKCGQWSNLTTGQI